MAKIETIHGSKQGRRPHYLVEWARRRGLEQVDIVREIGADKSLVSRWFAGATPSRQYHVPLALMLSGDDDPDTIFRHPDDDWLRRFLRGRTQDEIARIKETLEFHFARKAG